MPVWEDMAAPGPCSGYRLLSGIWGCTGTPVLFPPSVLLPPAGGVCVCVSGLRVEVTFSTAALLEAASLGWVRGWLLGGPGHRPRAAAWACPALSGCPPELPLAIALG